jgi:hypothetical protein
MSDIYQEIEKRVIRACERFENNEFSSMRQAATAEAAPYQRVLRRLNGGLSRSTRNPVGRKLPATQGAALCIMIMRSPNGSLLLAVMPVLLTKPHLCVKL